MTICHPHRDTAEREGLPSTAPEHSMSCACPGQPDQCCPWRSLQCHAGVHVSPPAPGTSAPFSDQQEAFYLIPMIGSAVVLQPRMPSATFQEQDPFPSCCVGRGLLCVEVGRALGATAPALAFPLSCITLSLGNGCLRLLPWTAPSPALTSALEMAVSGASCLTRHPEKFPGK